MCESGRLGDVAVGGLQQAHQVITFEVIPGLGQRNQFIGLAPQRFVDQFLADQGVVDNTTLSSTTLRNRRTLPDQATPNRTAVSRPRGLHYSLNDP